MAFTLTDLPPCAGLDFDEVIDVRAPAEFADDHIPGAVNLPVLSDEERARVGTIYVREDRFRARKVGAALVARNAAAHLEGPLADRGGGWRPLVYCWRGGQRSGSFATILAQVGWRVEVLDGGYRSYRRLVSSALYEAALPHRVVLVDGGTGLAKTRLLHHLSEAGAQVIDLEGLARHRGSNFGGLPGGQPSQKMFESHLSHALVSHDPDRPLFLEAESNAIGRILLPPAVWKAMSRAEVVRLDAPLDARAAYLTRAYPDLLSDGDLLRQRIDSLRPYHPGDRIETWHQMAAHGRHAELAAALVEWHYDPRYGRTERPDRRDVGTLTLEALEEPDLAAAAARILAMVSGSGEPAVPR